MLMNDLIATTLAAARPAGPARVSASACTGLRPPKTARRSRARTGAAALALVSATACGGSAATDAPADDGRNVRDAGLVADGGARTDAGDPDPGATPWTIAVADAQQVLDVYPELWPVGEISRSAFEAMTPFNSGHWKITEDRWARVHVAAAGKDMLRFHDPKLELPENSDWNPWNRRAIPEVDWGDSTITAVAGATPGRYGFTDLEVFFPRHEYTGSDLEEGWNPGFHGKFADGWSPGSVGATGNNPQPEDDRWEAVFTTYGIKTLQDSDNYSLTAKGDFGDWESGRSEVDRTGVYNPLLDIDNPAHYQNYFFLGLGFYAHDTRQTYNYENMMYFLWPGTNYRVVFTVDTRYQLRWFIKLNDADAAPFDGEVYVEMRIMTAKDPLPPGIELGKWFTVRHLTDVDFRGAGTLPVIENGFGHFWGGGYGSSFGHNEYHPEPRPPYYARNLYYGYKRNFVK
jgi:hypothetical protein